MTLGVMIFAAGKQSNKFAADEFDLINNTLSFLILFAPSQNKQR